VNRRWLILLVLLGAFLWAAPESDASPPRPEPHPSACKKERKAHKPCKANLVKRAYTYRIIWRVEDQDGNVTYLPGECTVPVRGPVTCSITISWEVRP
jgi:hypothetical protein